MSRSTRSRRGSCASSAIAAAMVNHQRWDDTPIREILDRMRHDGCGGRAGKAGLLTGIEGVSSRPVRRIMLREG